MTDFLLAVHDGMRLYPLRALLAGVTAGLVAGLALSTALGLIPLAIWGALLTWPLLWLSSGALWLVAVKLGGLIALLIALCALLAVWAEEGVRQ